MRHLLVAMIAFCLLSPGVAMASVTGQVGDAREAIPVGGIGDTRDRVLTSWGFPTDVEPVLESAFAGQHYIVIEKSRTSYQLHLIFEVENDHQPRSSDRLIALTIDLMTRISFDDAETFLAMTIPSDSKKGGPLGTNIIGDPSQQYSSEALSEAFSGIENSGIDTPGTFWVVFYPSMTSISLIEITMLDPDP